MRLGVDVERAECNAFEGELRRGLRNQSRSKPRLHKRQNGVDLGYVKCLAVRGLIRGVFHEHS